MLRVGLRVRLREMGENGGACSSRLKMMEADQPMAPVRLLARERRGSANGEREREGREGRGKMKL